MFSFLFISHYYSFLITFTNSFQHRWRLDYSLAYLLVIYSSIYLVPSLILKIHVQRFDNSMSSAEAPRHPLGIRYSMLHWSTFLPHLFSSSSLVWIYRISMYSARLNINPIVVLIIFGACLLLYRNKASDSLYLNHLMVLVRSSLCIYLCVSLVCVCMSLLQQLVSIRPVPPLTKGQLPS